MANEPNPIVLSAVGTTLRQGRLLAFIWEGVTTSGDTVEIRRLTGEVLWAGRTDTTQTYLGINFGEKGPTVEGVRLFQISSGRVLIYFKEN